MSNSVQPAETQQTSGNYVLMTAAHNEETLIEAAIRSVVSQTVRPLRWVIVSDNSSDRTAEIVASYARQHDFIRLLELTRPPGRDFGAKVQALHQGCELFANLDYEFIGNLDADISLEPNYFAQLIARFRQVPRLGLAGGFVYEDESGEYRSRKVNDTRNVAHAAQLLRRECYVEIGGYAVLKYGGEDWYAQTRARMAGWQVEALPQLKIFHHRLTGSGSGAIQCAVRLGRMDYSFGSDPLFETFKCLRRWHEKPYLLTALARLASFFWGYFSRETLGVPNDFATFLRQEQRERLWSQFRSSPADHPNVPASVARQAKPDVTIL